MENFKITLEKSENFLTAFGVSEERATEIGNKVADIMEDKSFESLSELIEKSVNEAATNQKEAVYIAFTLGKYVRHSEERMKSLEESIGWLSSLTPIEGVEFVVGKSLDPKDRNLDKTIQLQRLVKLNQERELLLKQLLN